MTDRHDVAWLIWCARKGYVTKEHRQFLPPWIRMPDRELCKEDVKEREICLSLADEVIEKVREIANPTEEEKEHVHDMFLFGDPPPDE
jgi:hypothetical protein